MLATERLSAAHSARRPVAEDAFESCEREMRTSCFAGEKGGGPGVWRPVIRPWPRDALRNFGRDSPAHAPRRKGPCHHLWETRCAPAILRRSDSCRLNLLVLSAIVFLRAASMRQSNVHRYFDIGNPLALAPWQTSLIVTICLAHLLLCAPLHNRCIWLCSLEPSPIVPAYMDLECSKWAIAFDSEIGLRSHSSTPRSTRNVSGLGRPWCASGVGGRRHFSFTRNHFCLQMSLTSNTTRTQHDHTVHSS